MKRLVLLIALVLFVMPVVAAEDFTGKWSGAFATTGPDGSPRDEIIHMDLQHKGVDLSGTAGPSAEQQWKILNGKVEGNAMTFEVQTPGPLIKFTLKFAEGHLKGEAAAEFEGQKLLGKIDAQRVKALR